MPVSHDSGDLKHGFTCLVEFTAVCDLKDSAYNTPKQKCFIISLGERRRMKTCLSRHDDSSCELHDCLQCALKSIFKSLCQRPKCLVAGKFSSDYSSRQRSSPKSLEMILLGWYILTVNSRTTWTWAVEIRVSFTGLNIWQNRNKNLLTEEMGLYTEYCMFSALGI